MHVPCQTRVGFLPGVQWVTWSGGAAGCVGQGGSWEQVSAAAVGLAMDPL